MDITFKKRAFVTGGTGYIGSSLVKRLIDNGWTVHMIVRPGSSLDLIGPSAQRISTYQYDGTVTSLMHAFECARPNVVFHLASMFLAQHSPDDIEKLISSNLIFATQLLEAMTVSNVERLINTGTSWQHFQNKEYCPVNLYSATKQAFEDVIKYYVEFGSIRVVTLSLFDTYGPNDPRAKLIPLLWKTVLGGGCLEMSPGEQLIDLVYIDDVISAFVLAAQYIDNKSIKMEKFGVSSNKPLKLTEIVDVFEWVAGVHVPISWGARPYRNREVMKPWSNFAQLPNWQPLVSLNEGILKSKPDVNTARNDV
jgi:nucleoside-diphosphate-sugar epimerase